MNLRYLKTQRLRLRFFGDAKLWAQRAQMTPVKSKSFFKGRQTGWFHTGGFPEIRLYPLRLYPPKTHRENEQFAFYLLKTSVSLLRPPKTTKMAGVTQAKARAAKPGGFKRGGVPIWTCPSFFVLFLSFLGLSRFFPGSSRLARGWSGDFPDSSLFSFLAY